MLEVNSLLFPNHLSISDLLLDLVPHVLDFAVDAKPEQIKRLLAINRVKVLNIDERLDTFSFRLVNTRFKVSVGGVPLASKYYALVTIAESYSRILAGPVRPLISVTVEGVPSLRRSPRCGTR